MYQYPRSYCNEELLPWYVYKKVKQLIQLVKCHSKPPDCAPDPLQLTHDQTSRRHVPHKRQSLPCGSGSNGKH